VTRGVALAAVANNVLAEGSAVAQLALRLSQHAVVPLAVMLTVLLLVVSNTFMTVA
jgi:hypothetical protein